MQENNAVENAKSTEFYRVEAYDLATFLQGVQDGVLAGYELDLTKNETYPFGSIGHYIVQLVPAKKKTVATLEVKLDTTQVQEQVQKIQDKIEEAQAAGVTDIDVEIPEVKVEAKKPGRKPKAD